MFCALLSGGSGVRLWPLSNTTRSKQYLKVLKGEDGTDLSIVQRVFKQINQSNLKNDNVMVIANKLQSGILQNQLGEDICLILEPSRRDTFPAIMLACAYAVSEKNAKDDDVIVILPVDPYTEESYFESVKSLEGIINNTNADMVLMGSSPTCPSEKFGYIVPESKIDGVMSVQSFKEKPDAKTAQELIDQGALWNCGVFCFKISLYKEIIQKYGILPDYESVYENYNLLPTISFDYAVVEKCEKIIVVNFKGLWKDLGSWETLTEEMATTSLGNTIIDEHCNNVHVVNELKVPTVVMGIENAIIIASSDGILVADKSRSAFLKDYVKTATVRPMYEERRWGNIRIVDCTETENGIYLTAGITLHKGKDFSYHIHYKHDETYIFMSGNGKLIVDGVISNVHPGMVVTIPRGAKHSLHATEEMKFLEIQSGFAAADEDMEKITLNWSEIEISNFVTNL
jgi:mannose-1-phosphate guanylyltransferase